MKVLVVSDTHGQEENLECILAEEGPIHYLIHAGDVEGQEDYFEVLADCPSYIVSGNNDFFSSLPREEVFFLNKYKILLTHGHYYGVSLGTERILEEAKDRGVQIVIFGHTHRPLLEEEEGIILMNPGSLTYPRQRGRRPTYIVMEIDEDGEMHCEVREM